MKKLWLVGSDKLYIGSRDETMRVWVANLDRLLYYAGVIKVGGEVGCMLSEGPCMFVGMPNLVKAWNLQTSAELSLNGPVGQVYSLVIGNDLLFAGTHDGSILAWKYNAASNCFEPAASLQGHTSAVVTLVVGANKLYSMAGDSSKDLERSYFDVLGLCCSSEVQLIDRILKPLEGVHHVSVIVHTRTVIFLHNVALISQLQIVKSLNWVWLEENVRMKGEQSCQNKWPSPFVVVCGLLLLLSFFKYVSSPFQWLALGVVVVDIIPEVLKAIASLRNLELDINILMLIAGKLHIHVIFKYAFSCSNHFLYAAGGSVFLKDYWEAGTIVFLLNISKWLETRASHRAAAVMSTLLSIAPQTVVLANTGEEVNTKEVMVNTRLAVKAGTMIPIDGVVVDGNRELEEKALIGESFPVSKQVDSNVRVGTVNLNGYITVKTTTLAEACVVAKMVKLVEEAQSNKSKTQRYVDKFAKYYTPGTISFCNSFVWNAKK
uniref:Putative cation-transporting P-type ATPase A/B, WD40/YVTN repeat-like-containing domain protein n=1 Tax=Helianthus annuus TaxID=4232 RepID=A0A251UBA9_HELAN